MRGTLWKARMENRILKSVAMSLSLFLWAPVQAAASEDWSEVFERLLQTYVEPGGVDYEAWSENADDLAALESVTKTIAGTKVGDLSHDARLAFYLNAYNAWILQLVLDAYPIESVKEIGLIPFSVFFLKKVSIAGEKMTLNHLEKGIIIEEFREPRIHFSINCASRSCPPLGTKIFRGPHLEQQMEKATSEFANSDKAARVDHTGKRVELVEIFKWYEEDFEQAGGAVKFLNGYRTEPIPVDYAVGFYDYDWSLNIP